MLEIELETHGIVLGLHPQQTSLLGLCAGPACVHLVRTQHQLSQHILVVWRLAKLKQEGVEVAAVVVVPPVMLREVVHYLTCALHES